MDRRQFLHALAAVPLACLITRNAAAPAGTASRGTLLQISPLAGFQFHAGPRLWPGLRAGDPLGLIREPRNPHDPHAVAVHWHEWRIGYVPRDENTEVAHLLDTGRRLSAHIHALGPGPSPWDRVALQICLEGSA